MRYKVGNMVIVREDLISNKYYPYEYKDSYGYNRLLFNSIMAEYRGKIGRIAKVFGDKEDLYLISIDGYIVDWYFNNAMLRSPSGLNSIVKLRKENQ